MTAVRQLRLFDTYEEITRELQNDFAKMSQFIVPVEDAERKLAVITQSISNSGKLVLLLGLPGSGKSTFIRSLTWRRHLPISELAEIDANVFFGHAKKAFDLLYGEIQRCADKLVKNHAPGTMMTIVINYLEHVAGQEEDDVRAFFRNLNGLLRKYPVLIIWPVTEEEEAQKFLYFASAVSGTVFSEQPILHFSGPSTSEFPRIAKDTIATLNPGLAYDDFLLNDDELSELVGELKRQPEPKQTIRTYLQFVRRDWQEKSGEVRAVLERIPKPTEIWFVVCFPEAESVVSRFARKSAYSPDDAWDAEYQRLSEYIVGNAQNTADWDPKRLQYALRGFFRTKIMFIPTNAIVSCVAAYGAQSGVNSDLVQRIRTESIDSWGRPVIAKRFLETAPITRQLKGEIPSLGKRRSGTSKSSIVAAAKPFELISRAAGDSISDQPINLCLAQALRDTFGVSATDIACEADHPYLPGIRPDLVINMNPNKVICVEMHYTSKSAPGTLANYVLGKLNRYMKQMEYIIDQPRQLSFPEPMSPW